MTPDLTPGAILLPGLPRRRRRRRAVAVLALGVTLFGTLSYFLATSGSSSPSITIAPGITSTGIATVTAMSQTVTGAGQGASAIAGVSIARVNIAASYTTHARLDVAWLDPQDAQQVLNNPNAQIVFTLYHPVATSSDGTATGSCPVVGGVQTTKVTDGATTYCTLPDKGATGSPSVSGTGTLLLAKNQLVGYLIPSVNGNNTDAACTATPATWCQTSSDGTGQRAIYAVAAITVPGGTPSGQAAQAGSLKFLVATTPM